MSLPPISLVMLATAWGPRFGGINAFNVELARSLNLPNRAYKLLCVVPHASKENLDDARAHGVTLIALPGLQAGDEMGPERLQTVRRALTEYVEDTTVWLGHDNKTGPLAIALRKERTGDKAVLVHHMAFGAYQDHKKGDSVAATAKRNAQRDLFLQADLCLAVGPMLQEHLVDLLAAVPNAPHVVMLVPGLAEPDPLHVSLGTKPPANFTTFLGGRLGSDDERIKQALLGVRGFGHAVGLAMQPGKEQHSIRRSPTLRMRGVPADQQDAVRSFCTAAASGQTINFDLADYTENRNAYFSDLAGSSVAVMPSWHEGFGLAAWEAIACQVPVVLGEQSGVYRLLNDRLLGQGLNRSVRAVSVQGCPPGSGGQVPHTDIDVNNVGQALFDIGANLVQCKNDAALLASNLRNDHRFTWELCAQNTVDAIEKHLHVTLLRAEELTVPPPPRPALVLSASGTPDFLRIPKPENWHPRQGISPSALLVARSRVVRFDPAREPILRDWLALLQQPNLPQISLRLVFGHGGSGKTRSALELLARAGDELGWAGLWMPADPPADHLIQWKAFLRKAPGRCLLAVDYAEGRQDVLLQWLQAAVEVAAEAPVAAKESLPWQLHVLCLGRSVNWWEQLDKAESCSEQTAWLLLGHGNLGASRLPDLPNDVAIRQATYHAALQDYARAMGKLEPVQAWQPRLDAAPYERPLYVHLAALAALNGERPAHASALLQSQLRREYAYWALQYAEKKPLSYSYWAMATAWLSLVQGAPQTTLLAALDAFGLPASIANRPNSWGVRIEDFAGLQPDLLAEALIVQQLEGPYGDRLLDQALQQDADTRSRVFEVLARLGQRVDSAVTTNEASQNHWPNRLVAALVRAWGALQQEVVSFSHVHGPSLAQWILPIWHHLSAGVQEKSAKELMLPDYSSPLLDFCVEVARVKLRTADGASEKAGALIELSARLGQLGGSVSCSVALAAAREAAEIYRQLVAEQPSTYQPELAISLSNLANQLWDQGDASSRAEALRAAHEAAEIHRQLAADQPSRYRVELALSLNNLARHLGEQGDLRSRTEALQAAQEAVEIYRQLAAAAEHPSAYLPELARSLHNLAIILSHQGDVGSRVEALRASHEAVEIRRQLAAEQPSAYRPDLAISLNNLGNHLAQQGDANSRVRALQVSREAAEIYRQLAAEQPSAYRPDLARLLNNMANRLAERGDASSRGEGLQVAREAAEIYRQLATEQPSAYQPDLAMALSNLANRLTEQGNASFLPEALLAAREAAKIYRQLVAERPSTHRPGLARSLSNLAAHLGEQDDANSRAEALQAGREAAEIYRQLAAEQPPAYRPDLAGSLNNLAIRLAQQGDTSFRGEALQVAGEATEIYRQLVAERALAYRPDLAMSLNNLAAHLVEQGDASSWAAALQAGREAVEIYRQLAAEHPSAHQPDLAGSLNNLAIRLVQRGDTSLRGEALQATREAAEIYRQLATEQPSAYRPDLAISLNNLAVHLVEQGDARSWAEALQAGREGTEIYRQLAAEHPSAYRPELAKSLHNLAIFLAQQDDAGSQAEALQAGREAAELYRQLAAE